MENEGQKRRVAGIDVGGTFTDLIVSEGGALRIAKVPTVPHDPAEGVLAALEAAGAAVSALDLLIHGTTVTTNAVLERRLAKTGLVTTRGFRDVLELGRRTRPQAYGMTGRFRPLIPRDLRLEVDERVEASGRIRMQLDEAGFRDALHALLAAGCEALVIHFLHSYANPLHEERALAIAAELWPNSYVTAGHKLLSEAREFERGVTAAVNASVQPVLQRYLASLSAELAGRGFRRELLVVNGNGGTVSARDAAREAAKTVMSGPASGVIAAARLGRQAGFPNLVTYDMGGTSTDVSLILDAEPAVSAEIELEYAMPIHLPMVAVHAVGAGGGSIARVNASGLITVGPDSAGARPGPVCFGRGGTEPTLTDANLALGRLDPERLLGVAGPVDAEAVRANFREKIGAATGLSGVEAAEAVLRVANIRMAGAIRMVSVARGHDPRDFALFAFGGAGPLHAAALARELGIPTVLVPPRPGLTNALGCALADFRRDFVNTLNRPVAELDATSASAVLARHRAEGERLIAGEAAPPEEIRFRHSADMQFAGQTHLINVSLPSEKIERAELQALFERAYFARFRVALPEIRAQLVNLNTSVIGVRPALDLSRLLDPGLRAASLAEAGTGERPVWFAGGFRPTPVYGREKLPLGAVLEGPAIIEQLDATAVLETGDRLRVDPLGNLVITVGSGA